MRVLFALGVLFVGSSFAQAETVIVRRGAAIVISGVGAAQDAAVVIARRGNMVHTRCGQTEGLGYSTVSANAAIRRACYWDSGRAVSDIGVARGVRGWYAVVRYR